MKLRIENQNLRFKISEDELKYLLEGYPVHTKVILMDKMIVAIINPTGRGGTMEAKLVLDFHDAYLNLLVPPLMVQELSDMGKSREGLKQNIGDVSVSLQVDMPEACYT